VAALQKIHHQSAIPSQLEKGRISMFTRAMFNNDPDKQCETQEADQDVQPFVRVMSK
jgi:hypothetical protein